MSLCFMTDDLYVMFDTGVADRTVADVIELFTDNYNKINPEFAIEKDAVHLTDNRYTSFYSLL